MTIQDVMTVLFLVFLEGVLSFDNALVLALLVTHLPPVQQKKALTWGMFGAFFFRFISLFMLNFLLQNMWIKLVGGSYLVYLAVKHFMSDEEEQQEVSGGAKTFWMTIISVELMDIAFSVDSILAAVAVSPKFYVVLAGGILGIVMMRFAATLFIKLIDKFPQLVRSAYSLVFLIGIKLIIEGVGIHSIDFHDTSGAPFYIFWGLMAASIASGFIKKPALA